MDRSTEGFPQLLRENSHKTQQYIKNHHQFTTTIGTIVTRSRITVYYNVYVSNLLSYLCCNNAIMYHSGPFLFLTDLLKQLPPHYQYKALTLLFGYMVKPTDAGHKQLVQMVKLTQAHRKGTPFTIQGWLG